MLTKDKEELHHIYIVYDCKYNYQDIKTDRFNFGLPYIEEKILDDYEYCKFLCDCCIGFLKENVFDDKYLAYKRWNDLLNKKVKEINNFLGD